MYTQEEIEEMRKDARLVGLNSLQKYIDIIERLEREATWLADQLVQELSRISKKRFQGAPDVTGEFYMLYESRQEAVKSWRGYAQQAVRKALEESQ